MKKMTCALLLGAAMTTAATANTSSASGAYVGVNVGAGNTTSKYSFKNTNDIGTKLATSATAAAGTSKAKDISTSAQSPVFEGGKMNPQFGLMFGYNMQMGQGLVGFEGELGFDTAKVAAYDDTATSKGQAYGKASVKRKMYYGLGVRGGFFVTPSTLVYARLGAEMGKWTASYDASNMQWYVNSANAGATNVAAGEQLFTPNLDSKGAVIAGSKDYKDGNATPANAFATKDAIDTQKADLIKKVDKNRVNLVVGLGTDIFMSKNLFLRFEYSALFGPKVEFNQYGELLSAISGTTLAHSFKIAQNRFKFGVGYKF